MQATGLRQVHLGPFILKPDASGRANPALTLSTNRIPPEGQYQLADRAALERVRQAAGELDSYRSVPGARTANRVDREAVD